MNPETYARLVRKSRAGDRRALFQLLRLAHTPISFQCRKLLRDDRAAEEMTRQILSAVPRQLVALPESAEFETWISRITASRCMQALAHTPAEEPEAAEALPEVESMEMDEVRTAALVQQLVDALPREPRIRLLLYSCAGLKLKGIAQLTGYSEADVLSYLNLAQKTVNTQLRSYHKMGVHFTPIPALSSLVRTAMYSSRDPKAAAAMAAAFLPKKQAPDIRVFLLSRLTPRNLRIAILAAGAVLLALLVMVLLMEI
jgi:DNA-directed RNA polymerase specialized sigma24 family protein